MHRTQERRKKVGNEKYREYSGRERTLENTVKTTKDGREAVKMKCKKR